MAADQRPLVLSTTTGTPVQIPAGSRLSLPTAAGGFYVTLDPGVQTATRVFTLPVTAAGDTFDVLGLAQSFSALKTFGAGATIKTPIAFQDVTDATKQWSFTLSGMTTAKTLTIASAQTTSQTLNIPNITATDTLATLGLANSFTAANTFANTANGSLTCLGGVTLGATSYANSNSLYGDTTFYRNGTNICVLQSDQTSANGNQARFLFNSRTSTAAVANFAAFGSIIIDNTNGAHKGALVFSTSTAGGSPVERVRVDDVGNVLVGTTATTGLTGGNGLRVASTTTAASSIAGAAVFGDASTAATNVSIGGGQINIGGTGDATAIGTAAGVCAGGFTFGKSIGLGLIAAPGSPFMGQIWNDSGRQQLMAFMGASTANGIKQCLPGVIATGYNHTAVANTNATSSILAGGTVTGSYTIPANFFKTGKVVRAIVRGTISNLASATINVSAYMGALVQSSGATTLTPAGSSAYFEASLLYYCSGTGASGTISQLGSFTYVSGTTTQVISLPLTNLVVDTTTANAYDLKITWGAASASNTIQASCDSLEVLN
jgi:hypothetical protein